MADSLKFDPKTKTFAVERWGGYVQVYNSAISPISSPNALADVNFFDGVRDIEDLRKMRDVIVAVILELEHRTSVAFTQGARDLLVELRRKET